MQYYASVMAIDFSVSIVKTMVCYGPIMRYDIKSINQAKLATVTFNVAAN